MAAPATLGGGPAPAAGAIGYAPSSSFLFLDEGWYRTNLIKAADLWNGGLDGESGMGAYREDFDGFFQVNLDRAWHPRLGMPSTSVAQSRASVDRAWLYMGWINGMDRKKTISPAGIWEGGANNNWCNRSHQRATFDGTD